jgi:hypothetical protein
MFFVVLTLLVMNLLATGACAVPFTLSLCRDYPFVDHAKVWIMSGALATANVLLAIALWWLR